MGVETGPVRPSASWWLRFNAWLGRIWRAFIRALSPPEPLPPVPVSPAPAPPPPQMRGRRTLQTPLVVPASGYVFTFRVHATFHWSAEGVYQEQLSSLMDALAPYPVRRLKALAARHARNHAPHRARELEQELQQALTEGGPWPFAWRGIAATCRPYVSVELDEQVKEAVRPYWEQLIRLDCEHDVRVRRAEYTERLSRQWTDILTDLLGSPAAAGAAEMTERELAEVVGRIVAEQRAAAEKLEDMMAEKASSTDMQERCEHFEQLRERLERRANGLFHSASTAPAGDGDGPV
ncbi:hypothetical protein NDQ86_22950 [Salinispora arenicola]|nr:hypothetical protein [Salinispora arenicola]